jgi:hypothetical protein
MRSAFVLSTDSRDERSILVVGERSNTMENLFGPIENRRGGHRGKKRGKKR